METDDVKPMIDGESPQQIADRLVAMLTPTGNYLAIVDYHTVSLPAFNKFRDAFIEAGVKERVSVIYGPHSAIPAEISMPEHETGSVAVRLFEFKE